MARLSVFGALIFCLSGFGESLPVYLGNLHGSFLPSVTAREPFEFRPGTPGDCRRSEAGSVIFHTCPVQGASATIRGAQGTLTVVFDKVHAEYYSQQSGDVLRTFYLTGNWVDHSSGVPLTSAARLTLRQQRSNPNDIRGTFTLVDYDISGAVQAAP